MEINLDDEIEHLYCGHCGSIDNVRKVDLTEWVRWLCAGCRKKVAEWI